LVENIASEEVVIEEKTLEEQQDSSNSDESVGIASLEENSNENGAETTIPENEDDLKIIEGIGPAIEEITSCKRNFQPLQQKLRKHQKTILEVF
jgi:predicted flap endonuclease-1-like 5' DNA nuclease